MAEVSNELFYERLKKLQSEVASVKDGIGEVRQEIVSVRLTQLGMRNDIHNIYSVLARQDDRLEPFENRLELRELAEPQRPFEAPPT